MGGGSHLSAADIQLAEIVVGVVILRLEFEGFLELRLCRLQFSQLHEIDAEIHSGARGVRLQAHGLLQVRGGLGVLRLRGVHQSEEFVDLETFRNLV